MASKIKSAPLQLNKYFFPYVEIAADAQYIPTEQETVSNDLDVKVNVDKNEEVYQVTLEITALPENEDKLIPYTIHLVTVGLFSVAPEWEEKTKLLRITGASMLYSASREFVITITSRGPWPPVILPTISFQPDIDHEHMTNK